MLLLLLLAGFVAGTQNAVAGGGSFITFPALLLVGLDARAANITSTIALFPGQLTTGFAGRRYGAGTNSLPFVGFVLLSLLGGSLGAWLLLATPATIFAQLVPWLVLFATSMFALGTFRKRPIAATTQLGRIPTSLAQLAISIYGGYFGGGIGFLMLAALSLAGLPVRNAAASKNVLSGVMNASAVLIFLGSPDVRWTAAVALSLGAIIGGQFGAWLIIRVAEKTLRIAVVVIGIALTIGLFVRAA